MPELPEVETTFRAIEKFKGRTLLKIKINNRNLRWKVDKSIEIKAKNQKILDIKRRAKYIIIEFKNESLLMHLGNILTSSKNKNLTHILINNSVHDSVGGQTTNSNDINFSEIAMKLGYKSCKKIYKDSEIKKELKSLSLKNKSTFIEIKSRPGYRKNIGRPKESLAYRKKTFMKLF